MTLTPTEARILGLLAQGKTPSEVADALFCDRRTVHWHLNHVYAKIKSKRLLPALIELGFIEPTSKAFAGAEGK